MQTGQSRGCENLANRIFSLAALQFGLNVFPSCVRAVTALEAGRAARRSTSYADHTKTHLQTGIGGLAKRMAYLRSGNRYPDSTGVFCDLTVSVFFKRHHSVAQ